MLFMHRLLDRFLLDRFLLDRSLLDRSVETEVERLPRQTYSSMIWISR